MRRTYYGSVFLVIILLVAVRYPVNARVRLSLQDAYELALRNNERLKIVRDELNVTEQNVRDAFGRLLPRISVSGESYRQKEIQQFGRISPAEETIVSGEIKQPIYHGGKNYTALTISELRQNAARTRLFRRTQVVLFDVARLYFEMLLSQKNVGIQKNALRRARTQLDRARGRRSVGKATRSTVLRAKVEVSDAQEQLEKARNSRRLAREDLLVELGVASVPETVVPIEFHPLTDTPVKTYRKRAYESRRDLRRQAHQVEAARARIDLERGDYYPTLNLFGSYNRFEDEVYHGSESDWRVSLRVSYPLFSGGRTDAQLQRSRYEHRSARHEHDRVRREVRRDVRRVYLDLRSQRTVLKTLNNRVESARENYRETSAQFDEGLATSVDASDALTILNEVELRLSSARNSLMLDRLRLKLATGTFLEDFLRKEMDSL